MRKIFIMHISVVMLCGMIIIAALSYYIETQQLKNNAKVVADYKLEQLEQTMQNNKKDLEEINENLRTDYITRAKAFAYIISKNRYVIDSQYHLNQIKDLLNVDELHVINEHGILRYGTVPKYFKMDFSATEQTREFLRILEDPTIEIVQDIRPNGYEDKEFQYVGVARLDEPGIVQIGMSPQRYIDAKKRNEWSYVLSRIPMDEGIFFMIFDEETHEVIAHSNETLVGKTAEEMGILESSLREVKNENVLEFQSNNITYSLKHYENTYLCFAQDNKNIYDVRGHMIFQILIYLTIIYIVIIFLVDQILKKKIINGVNEVITDLNQIKNGNLDTVVQVKGNHEFEQLSGAINHMVQSILEITVKMSKIIDLVDMPIGAFEINKDMSRVLVTERVGELLHLSKEEEKGLFQNKELFINFINDVIRRQKEEFGVCKISDNPKRYIKVTEVQQEPGIFGIILEVTDEVLEKQKIRMESDYDPLTGLCNRRKFEREVKQILSGEISGHAAIIMFDLDKFKNVNDSYGHGFGDTYLKHIAKIFTQVSDDNCIIGRRSGDEFYMFQYNCHEEEKIENQLQKLYQLIEKNPIQTPDGKLRVIGVSSGLAFYTSEHATYDELLNAADQALYEAKKQKKGSYYKYSSCNPKL